MEQLANEIRPAYADRAVNEKLTASQVEVGRVYSLRYNQNEEFFIEIDRSIVVPSFPIHHDVRQLVPRADYSNSLRDFVDHLLPAAPNFFSDLTYFFDPAEIQKPCFYRLYRVQDSYYLYLLRINLQFRPLEAELLERGSNDITASFGTRRLYIESDLIPLASVITELGRVVAFTIKQLVSQTWIGETGKGYLVRGIWMDMELTKFFTKLFLPAGKRFYPYYPFTCKYKTICMTVLDPTPEKRRTLLPLLHAALSTLEPEMERIQGSLKTETFSEQLPVFKELKAKVPQALEKPWTGVAITPYLNDNDQKEFLVEF